MIKINQKNVLAIKCQGKNVMKVIKNNQVVWDKLTDDMSYKSIEYAPEGPFLGMRDMFNVEMIALGNYFDPIFSTSDPTLRNSSNIDWGEVAFNDTPIHGQGTPFRDMLHTFTPYPGDQLIILDIIYPHEQQTFPRIAGTFEGDINNPTKVYSFISQPVELEDEYKIQALSNTQQYGNPYLLYAYVSDRTGCEQIDTFAFGGCPNLYCVRFPNTLKQLGTADDSNIGVFCGNQRMEVVDLRNCTSLERVYMGAFLNMETLRKIIFPPNLKYIHDIDLLIGNDIEIIITSEEPPTLIFSRQPRISITLKVPPYCLYRYQDWSYNKNSKLQNIYSNITVTTWVLDDFEDFAE